MSAFIGAAFDYPQPKDLYVKRQEIADLVGGRNIALGNFATGGSIGTAPNVIDGVSTIAIAQTTASQTLTAPNPTNTTVDHSFSILSTGSQAFTIFSTVLSPGSGIMVTWEAVSGGYVVTGTASGSTALTITGGKTVAISNSLTFAGTDGTTMTFPSTSATVARTDAANTFTGVQTFSSTPVFSSHVTAEGVTSTGATGTGAFVFATTPTLVTPVLGVATGTSVAVSGLLTTSSPTANFGYATGAGGAVTQATNKSTGVTLNTNTGAITMNNASLAGAATVSFTLTNSTIGANDVVNVCVKSGAATGLYTAAVTASAAGSCQISVTNIGSTAGEVAVIQFVVVGGAVA